MDKVKSILFTVLDWIKTHKKIVIAALIIIVVAIVAVNLFGSKANAKRSVKSYVSALNKSDTDKILDAIDVQGYVAWNECDGKANKFDNEYDDIDDDDVKDYEDTVKKLADNWCEKKEDDYDKYTIKVSKISKVEKKATNLYKVKAKLKITTVDDDDKDTDTKTVTFYVYKGKVISEDKYILTSSNYTYIEYPDYLEYLDY